MIDDSRQSEQAVDSGNKWGDPIRPVRQAELQGYLDRWQAEMDHRESKGPFYNVELTGADVYWLAEQSVRDEDGSVPNLHLETLYVNPLMSGTV